ncbi:13369_t:CDS:2 [Funneliformis geosporum]|nr:13369_t:CDS:2 [Funneliformis geosporum]
MPKKFKGENTKVTAAKERKTLHQKEINSKKQAEKDQKETEEWSVGAKDASKKEAQRLKKEAQLAKKNEAARLLEQEEKELSQIKPLLKPTKKSGEDKKAIKRSQKVEQESTERREIPVYTASNIDDALDLLAIATETSSSPGVGKTGLSNSVPMSAANIERHPERRFKAAFRAYEEREILKLKEDNPGLQNPFNQSNVLRHNASKEESDKMIEAARQDIENRLRV